MPGAGGNQYVRLISGGVAHLFHCCWRARRQRRSRCQTRSMARRHAREQKRRAGDRRSPANPW
ncbi:MAG TPA: hypothetical protein VMT32_17145 [Bryobacteraceae bacterium]|nr:hypothetical protein [Bryobacteraceae bacterium]